MIDRVEAAVLCLMCLVEASLGGLWGHVTTTVHKMDFCGYGMHTSTCINVIVGKTVSTAHRLSKKMSKTVC